MATDHPLVRPLLKTCIRRAWAPLVLCMISIATGCQIFGVAAAKLGPAEKIRAVYLLQKVPTGVVVEDFGRRGASAVECEELYRVIFDRLTAYLNSTKKPEDAVPIVPATALHARRRSDPAAFKKLTIQEMGRAIKVEQLIYVDLVESRIESSMANQMLKARFAARVRVIDVQSGETRWPLDAAEGYLIEIDTPYTQTTATHTDLTLRSQTLQAAGDQIAKLFYTYEVE